MKEKLEKIDENFFMISSDIQDPVVSSYEINDGDTYMYDMTKFELGSTWFFSQMFRMWIVMEWIKQWDSPPHKRISILDLGCSWSQLYRVWITHGHYFNHPRTHYVGVDLDKSRLVVGRNAMRVRKSDTVVHILADVTKPRDYGKYDVVACLETLEHVPREAGIALVRNAWANVAPGGCLMMSSPNPQKDKGQEAQWGDKHAHEWQWEEAREMITETCVGGTMVRECGVTPTRGFGKSEFSSLVKKVRPHLPYSIVANVAAVGSDASCCKQWMCKVSKP